MCSCFGLVPVAGSDIGAPDPEFADLLRIQDLATIVIDQFDFVVQYRQAGTAEFLDCGLAFEPQHRRTGFSHAVALLHIDAFGTEGLEDGQRTGGSAHSTDLEVRQVRIGKCRLLADK